MIWAKMLLDSGTLLAWFWQHRSQFAPAFEKAGDVVGSALASPGGAIHRIGNTIVFGQEGGGEKVLAFIEQTSPQLEAIKTAVSDLDSGHAVLLGGQQAIAATLSSLQCVSMVSLGITAVTPLALTAQFVALEHRLKVLQKTLKTLVRMFATQNVAVLQAGIEHLRLATHAMEGGSPVDARDRLNSGIERCLDSVQYFGALLDQEVEDSQSERTGRRLLMRHHTVAVLGSVGCHIGLGKDESAIHKLDEEMPRLQRAARRVIAETIGSDPERFLVGGPEHGGATLDVLSDLFGQCREANLFDSSVSYTASTWFEQHREPVLRLKQPWWGKSLWRTRLQQHLADATSALEEINRVRGLRKLLQSIRHSRSAVADILNEIKRVAQAQDSADCMYVIWAIE